MPFNKLKLALIASAACAFFGAHAQQAPLVPQSPVAPAVPAQAPKADVAVPALPDGLTLRQLEVLQRKAALGKAKRALREQERAESEAAAVDAPPQPMVRAPNGQMIPANMIPPVPTPQEQMASYQVLSTVAFGGTSTADIINDGLVTTVKVGDFIGPARVVSIVDNGMVTVSMMGRAPQIRASTKKGRAGKTAQPEAGQVTFPLARALDAVNSRTSSQPQFSASIPGLPQGGALAPRLFPQAQGQQFVPGRTAPPFQMANTVPPNASPFSADATSVPMVGRPGTMPSPANE